jgi:predicted Zn-dependent protease
LQIAEIGLRLLPKSDRLQLQKGVVRAMKGEYEEARQAFTSSAEIAPKKGLPQVALGLVLLQMDQPDDAARVLRTGITSKEDRYLFDWFLAEALGRSGAAPGSPGEAEAVAALRRSIAQRPDLAQPRVLLGKFLARRGELDGAVDQFERALAIDADNSTATYQLAQAYRKKGDKRANALFAKISKEKAEERQKLLRKGLELITEGAK